MNKGIDGGSVSRAGMRFATFLSFAILISGVIMGFRGPGRAIAGVGLSGGPESAGQEIQIREKDGVTFVRNPAHPVAVPGEPGKLTLVPELIIGKETDTEEAMIYTLRGLQVDGQGDMYVLDGKVDLIKVYGPDGAYRRTIGRKGPGPGEFGSVSVIAVTGTGSLHVYDIGNHRVSEYSADGKCLGETPFVKWRPFGLAWDSRGSSYGEVLDMQRGFGELIMKFDRNGEKTATPVALTIVSNPNEAMVPIEFFRLLFRVDAADRLVWASTGEYAFHVVDTNGRLVRTIERECRPRGYTKEDKARLEKDQFGDKGPPQGAVLFYPDHRPVLESFILGDEGRLYARTFDKDARGEVYHDVFDKEGRYVSRFTLSGEERLAVVKRGKAYCMIRESEEGTPQVKRYAMRWE